MVNIFFVGAIFVSLIKITCIDPDQFAIITGFTQYSELNESLARDKGSEVKKSKYTIFG